MAKAAKTSKELEVTPPLLVEASLNKTVFLSSNIYLAVLEMNKFAPSTIYLNLQVPSFLNIYSILFKLILSGLPPQGTKKSAVSSGYKWKVFLKWIPDSTNSPFGNVI